MHIEAIQNNWENMLHIPCTFLRNPTKKEEEKIRRKNITVHLKIMHARNKYKTGIIGLIHHREHSITKDKQSNVALLKIPHLACRTFPTHGKGGKNKCHTAKDI